MEGVRGFAVLLVFCVHYQSLFGDYLARGSLSYRAAEFAGIVGHSGVDLFFVLSGYLIYGKVFGKPGSYGRFFRRRFRRIYPAFLCVLAVYLVLHFTFFPISSMPARPVPAGIYILQNAALLPGLFNITPVFTVAWSLSYEMFFYAALPVLVIIAGLGRRLRFTRCLFFVVVALGYAALNLAFPYFDIPRLHFMPAGHPQLILFVVGILIREATDSAPAHRTPGWGEWLAAVLFLTGIAGYYALSAVPWMTLHLQTGICKVAALSFGLPGFVFYCFGRPGIFQRAFSWTPLRWLGNMSYSYYLVHGLALQALRFAANRLIPPDGHSPLSFAAWLPAGLAVTWVVSTLLFLAVEKPVSLDVR
jgi:peptidoglycan/LPS O-acetylase OafA/YrhL